MGRVGKAVAYGAVTVVNALAGGKGAALGIDLWTEAAVKLTDEPGIIRGKILSDPGEDTSLIEKIVKRVLKRFGLEGSHGAYVETRSNIPIARGLKSSSVAANALVLAALSAVGGSLEDLDVINMAVDVALEAKVTVTGAFDDACASYLGNIVVTDNMARKVLKHFKVEEGFRVLILVPQGKAYTVKADIERMRLMAGEVDVAFREALTGNYWTAMKLNGLIYASTLGYNPGIAVDALAQGAVAAGLSGKGPAVAAVVLEENVEKVKDVWRRYEGEVIEAGIKTGKAHVIP